MNVSVHKVNVSVHSALASDFPLRQRGEHRFQGTAHQLAILIGLRKGVQLESTGRKIGHGKSCTQHARFMFNMPTANHQQLIDKLNEEIAAYEA